MFKLSVISDEISQDFQRVVDVCQEYEVPMVEPRSVWEKAPQDLTDDDVAKMKQILDAAGMSVSAIAAPFFKCDLGDADQLGTEVLSFGFDPLGHGAGVIDLNPMCGDRAILPSKLPDIGEDMTDCPPDRDAAEELVECCPRGVS